MIGAQGAVDYGIKAAELNKDALARYNADLAAQGINDKSLVEEQLSEQYILTLERGIWMKLMVC